MKQSIFIIILLASSFSIYADNLNKRTGLSPKVRNIINKQLAKTYIIKKNQQQQTHKTVKKNTYDNQQNTGSVQTIGSVSNVRYAPKEVVTAVRGNIVNICFHCR